MVDGFALVGAQKHFGSFLAEMSITFKGNVFIQRINRTKWVEMMRRAMMQLKYRT